MAFIRPTRAELIERLKTDLETKFSGADAHLPGGVLFRLAAAIGAAQHHEYGALADLVRQAFVSTAIGDLLNERCGEWGKTITAAVQATGTVTVTGDPAGSIPAGRKLQRADGEEYQTTNTIGLVIGATGSNTVGVEAVTGGDDGNCDAGTELQFVSAPTGVNSTATVIDDITDGDDEETAEELRTRTLAHLQSPAHGGRNTDYQNWALGYLSSPDSGRAFDSHGHHAGILLPRLGRRRHRGARRGQGR